MANAISVTISATDRATEVINKVNRGFEDFNRRVAVVSAAGERFGKSVSKLGDVSGVNRIATGFVDVGRRVTGAAESLGRFAPALGGITGAASIAGLAKLAETWSGFSARLGLDAARINTSASTLHGLQGAARLAGSSAEALTDGMRTLGDNLVDAAGGRSPETVMMLRTLGINLRDASTGGARLATDVLPEVADKIKGLRTPALQAMVATRLFGGAGEALLPFLRRGAAGIAEYNEQAKRYGVQNQAGVQAAMNFREAQTRLGLAVEGVGYTIAQTLAPVLVPMLTRLSDWVAAHREDIADFFKQVGLRLQSWVDGGGPQRLADGLKDVGAKIKAVVDFMGGWENAAIAVAVVMNAQVIASVLSVVGAVGKLTFAVGTQLVAAIGLAETAMSQFNTRTLANPVLRAASLGISLFDRLGQGIPVEQLTPEMREHLGLPPMTVPGALGAEQEGPGANQGASPSWWQRNMPTWLGGHGGGQGGSNTPIVPGSRALPQGAPSQQAFIDHYGPMAQRVAEQTGISARSILGQLWQETGGRGDRGNNPFNIQAGAGYTGPTITRGDTHADGTPYQTPFRAYRDLNEAADDYAALLKRRYPGALNAGDDPERFARGLKAGGYAEDPEYVNHVVQATRRLGPLAPTPGAAPISTRIDAPAPPPLAPPVPLPPMPAVGQAGPNGRVAVDINFQNQPPGLRMTTSTEGGVTVRAPRIETAMPSLALP